MSFNWTKYGRKVVLDHFYGRVNFPFPSGLWATLLSGDPTDAGSLTNELTDANFVRVNIVSKMSDTVLGTGIISSSADIVWPAFAADSPEITYLGLMDSSVLGSGNMIMFGAATTSRIVSAGDQFKIRAGQLTFQQS